VKGIWKKAVTCFLVIALVTAFCFGYGCDGGGEGQKTILIGLITDVTGVAGNVLSSSQYAVQDLARYINEDNPIPGARIKVAVWDCRYDPSRDIPGYDWLKGLGAKVIIAFLPGSAETLAPFAKRDKIPIVTQAADKAYTEPPGWVFCLNAYMTDKPPTLMKWLSERWPNYPTRPKIGYVGWNLPGELQASGAMKKYCQANPEEFEWVGAHLTPTGNMIWSGQIKALKDCDYIYVGGGSAANAVFVRDFRSRGYTATFMSCEIMSCGRGLFIDMCGWDAMDGTIEMMGSRWWNETSYPIPKLANELIHRYHPGEAQDIIHMGLIYIGAFHGYYVFYDILRQAIEEVGAENFDSQAFYDKAIKFKKNYEGFSKFEFSEVERVPMKSQAVYRWSADEGDLVRVSDWLPLIEMD